MTTSSKSPDTDRKKAEARSRAYVLAGSAIHSAQQPGETDIEFDERYKVMNLLLDKAMEEYPDPIPPTEFNPDYPNEPAMRP
jgi:hypothetical protein